MNYDEQIERRAHPENFLLDDDIADYIAFSMDLEGEPEE